MDQNITFQVTYEQNFNDSSDLIAGNIYRDYAKIKVSSSVPKEELIINKNKIFRHDLEMDQFKNSGIPRLAVPKFLVQRKEYTGKRTLAGFSAMIDAELAKIKK